MSQKPKTSRDREIRYGGRTVEFHIFVNTDATEEEIAKRIQRLREFAGGSRRDMVVISASTVSPEEAAPLWEAAIQAASDLDKSKN